MGLFNLPVELIYRIAEHLEFEKDINSLTRTNKRFYNILNRHLYQRNIKQWKAEAVDSVCRSGNFGAMRKFCDEGVSIKVHEDSRSPLVLAVTYGHEDIVRLFLEKMVDSEVRRSCERSRGWYGPYGMEGPLEIAVKNGHEGIVRLLLSRMTNFEYTWEQPFFLAVQKGHESLARLLLSHMRRIKYSVRTNNIRPYVRKSMNEGGTVMESAVESGNLNLVKLLVEELKYEVEPTWQGQAIYKKMTPLGRAANKGYTEIAQYLISVGADPNATNPETWRTVLGYAVLGGHLQTARLLIEHGANPDPHLKPSVNSVVAHRLSDYPLALAGLKGDQEMVHLLLEYIDLERKIDFGNVVNIEFLLPIVAACGLERLVQRLLGKGCYAYTVFQGRVPYDLAAQGDALTLASKFGHTGVVKILLGHGVRPNGALKADERMRPLAAAVEAGHQQVVELLLDAGANPNSLYCRDPQHSVDLEAMLEVGIDPDPDNPEDCPILEVAVTSEPIFKLLLDRGANASTLRFPLKSRLLKKVLESENASLLRALLNTQFDLPIYNKIGVPFFFLESAAMGGAAMFECVMEYLLSKDGPKPESRDLYEALKSAIRFQKTTVVEMLLRRYGLELKGQNMAECFFTAASSPSSGFSYTESKSVLDLLLQHGADINARNNFGQSCLSALIGNWHGDFQGAKLVIEHGANYLSANTLRPFSQPPHPIEKDPLSAAIKWRNVEIVDLLLQLIDAEGIPLEDVEPHIQQAKATLPVSYYGSSLDKLKCLRALEHFYWRRKYPVP